MNPEQNHPVLPSPAPAPITPPEPAPHQKRPTPKWVWVVIVGAVVLIAGFAILFVVLLTSNSTPQKNGSSTEKLSKLTIGTQDYIYPCSVATEADYAQIFKLDDQTVGTVSETAALPANKIEATTSDLAKIAPMSRDRYKTSCNYTLAKTGAARMNRIEIDMEQYASEKEAQANFKSERNGASGDYTNDGVDNGTHQLTTLPSFPDVSFVRLPDADSILPGLETTFLSGTRLISLSYDFWPGESTVTVLPLIDQYAKAIQSKVNLYKGGKPVDLTGRASMSGKKFVSLCYQTDIQKLASAFGDIQFRPDEAATVSTYGSLAGSRAAAEGAESNCKLGFSTAGDRQSQKSLKSASQLYANKMWPQSLTVGVNSFRTSAEAQAYLIAKKANVARPSSFGTPVIEDLTGMGDSAYKLHKEYSQDSLFSGEKNQIVYIEDTYTIASGGDVIVVSLNQISDNSYFKTAPLKVTDAEAKKAYDLLRATVADRRK